MTTAIIALAGSPNSGKSSLFNALTGSRQKVGNYPGVTVEKKMGSSKTPSGHPLTVVDLPGTYSLDPNSPDEQIAFDVLTRAAHMDLNPDVVVAVADATNLERTLGLVLELKNLATPVIVALNMMDLAKSRGIKLDLKKLSIELGVPVIPTVAIKKNGIDQLLTQFDNTLKQQQKAKSSADDQAFQKSSPEDRFAEIDRILELTVSKPTSADILTYKLDRVLLHPILGGLFLFAFMLLMFQAVFSWAEAPMEWIEGGLGIFGEFVAAMLPEGYLSSLLVDGIIAGVGSVLVFLPQIMILFFFIFLMESTGYMMRAAFIMDRIMSLVGLQGRAFVPLLSSFACAIPGIMATRTIKDPKERLVTILVAPLMTCAARLPVYVLLIAAFIPNTLIFGPIRMQGFVMFCLFLFGIISAIIVAFVMRKTALKGVKSPFILELPSYKFPNLKNIFISVFMRAKVFVKRAGTVILGVSITLWFLSTFPKAPENYDKPAITYSFAGKIGKAIEPVILPLGFDWRIGTGLIPGFAAREVMVGALATVFAVEDSGDEDAQIEKLSDKIQGSWPLATGLALLVWYIFSPQCLATFAVARRETNGWKWPVFMFSYMLALAYVGAFLTYQLFK